MVFRHEVPVGLLGQFVTGITFFEGLQAQAQAERFLPNGGIELVVDLTETPKFIFDTSGVVRLQECRKAWVSGIRTEHITISGGTGGSMMLVFFHPHAARMFFGCDMNLVSDTVLDADGVLGSSVLALRDRILNEPDPDAKMLLVRQWLHTQVRPVNRDYHLSLMASDRIQKDPCSGTIDRLAEEAGVSHKHLTAVFKRTVGITPKQFQRIHRFQYVIRLIENGAMVNWTSVALDCGFYDQAHFSREFRRFSGFTPSEYLEAKGDVLNYIPIS